MEKLGLFDELFYKADQYNLTSVVMAGASVLVPADRGTILDADALARHLAARLEKMPELRQRFVRDPLRLGSIYRADDPDFNVWDHIDVVYLDDPGDHGQLERALAGFLNEAFPLARLWHWRLIGGLQDGRVAIVNKMHHALTDGMGARKMMESIYDLKPVALESPDGKGPSDLRPSPGRMTLLGRAWIENLDRTFIKTPRFIYRNARPVLSSVQDLVDKWQNKEADKKPSGSIETKPTSLNYVASGDNPRSLSYIALPVDELKEVARQCDCKINDICLLLFSCALQDYFDSIGEQVDFDLTCVMPISVRDSGTLKGGNQLTAAFLVLHNTEPDLIKRLQKITADAQEAKHKARPQEPAKGINFGELTELIFPSAFDMLFYLAGAVGLLDKVGDKRALFNVFLTNMPGPRETLYLANGRIDQAIPLVPALPVVAVSPGVVSHGDEVAFGFNCDATVIADPKVFTASLERSFRKLQGKTVRQGKATGQPARRRKGHQKAAAKKQSVKNV